MIERILELEWLVLALRILFVLLLYLFIAQVIRFGIREMVGAGIAAAPPERIALLVVDPADAAVAEGGRFPVEPGTVVGRQPGSGIRLDDGFVSGAHAAFGYDRGRWWLRDLGSTNGTRVNGAAVRERVTVRVGDIVQFGRVTTRIVSEPGDARGDGVR